MIYCVVTGKTIDVGSVMHASILHCIEGVAVGLYFPSLIMVLCRKAGVVWSPSEEVIQPVHAIDIRMMMTVKGWDGDTYSSGTFTASPWPQP